MALNVFCDKKHYVVWKTVLPRGAENSKSKYFTLHDRQWWLVLERNWNETAKEETWSIHLKHISPASRVIELKVVAYFEGEDKNLAQLSEDVYKFSRQSAAQIVGFGKSLLSLWCSDGDFNKELTFLFTFEVPLRNLEQLSGETEIERQSLELLSLDVEKLYRHRNHPDVFLKCSEVVFAAHRALLSARSEVFSSMLLRTEIDDEVAVLDMQPAILDIFLQYLYSGRISTVLNFETVMELYQVAVYYRIPQLQSHCASYLLENLKESSICSILLLAERFKDTPLMDAAVSFLVHNSGFFESVAWQAFTNEQSGLAIKVYNECNKYKESGL